MPYSTIFQYDLRGFVKAYAADQVSLSGDTVPEEMTGPYYEGLRDGETYATEGFPVEPTCYSTTESHEGIIAEIIEGVDFTLEAAGIGHQLAKLAFSAALFEGAVLFLMVAIAGSKGGYPEEALAPRNYEEFSEFLGTIGEPVSIELFIGGGIDWEAEDCQLQMTRVYKTAEEAMAAIQQMGKAKYILCSLRTDMSGGLKVVDQLS